MCRIVCCWRCNSESSKNDAITVDVNFTSTKFCNVCHSPHSETKNMYFCSSKCFLEHIAEKPEDFKERADTVNIPDYKLPRFQLKPLER
jgi:hypothetical protein